MKTICVLLLQSGKNAYWVDTVQVGSKTEAVVVFGNGDVGTLPLSDIAVQDAEVDRLVRETA